MKRTALLAMALCGLALGVSAQVKPDAHTKKDIERHRAMAQAHEEAARCLESGKAEDDCLKQLQARCKGLAIGKYCGMKHEH